MTRLLIALFSGIVFGWVPAAWAQAPLRSGDTVEIRIGGVPSDEVAMFTGMYTVDTRGNLNLPFVGDVRAAGSLPAEVQRSIESRLKVEQIYTNPTIIINTERGGLVVNVGGAVRQPGRFPYTPDMTLMNAINAAGGFNDYANESRIRLRREGRETMYSAKDIRRNPSVEPKLLPGDQIEVDQSFW